MAIKVTSVVNIYEKNGNKTKGYDEQLQIESARIYSDWVTIVYGDLRLTVVARDLSDAITNACNTGAR